MRIKSLIYSIFLKNRKRVKRTEGFYTGIKTLCPVCTQRGCDRTAYEFAFFQYDITIRSFKCFTCDMLFMNPEQSLSYRDQMVGWM